MNNPLIEIIIIFLLLLLNGVFAMAEIAIVSVRRARLQQLVSEGDRRAAIALDLAENPNQFLATIQTGITLVGILAGAFGGATLGREVGQLLNQFELIAPYGEPIAIALVVVGVTYFSLVIGELAPKRIALNNAERISLLTAPAMHTLSRMARPAVWLLSGSTDAVLRLLGIRSAGQPDITEEEIKVLIDQGTQVGVFEEVEQDMIERVLRLDKRRINIVMTPRPQIEWLDINESSDQILQRVAGGLHSRMPVCDGELDRVLGIVYAKDLLNQAVQNEAIDLESLLRPPLYVPENIFVIELIELVKQERSHLALVTDEFGGIEGLITPIDLLEAIVGDIPNEEEVIGQQVTPREDGSWLVDGMLHIDQLKEKFELERLPEENVVNFQTVGGFIINQFGSIPQAGDYFEWNRFRFEVVDMDGRRVDKIIVFPRPVDEVGEANGEE